MRQDEGHQQELEARQWLDNSFSDWVVAQDMAAVIEQLSEPFPPSQVTWRVGSRTADKKKGKVLAYLDARDVMQRLDDVVGPAGWMDSYQETPKRLLCKLSLNIGGQWISKTDGAGDSDIEGEKGGISGAFKRAAVKWGIGRYLYGVEGPWVELYKDKYLPKDFDGSQYLKAYAPLDYMATVRKHWDTINAVKEYIATDKVDSAREALGELTDEEKKHLWRAPSNGGVFETKERSALTLGTTEKPQPRGAKKETK